LVSSPLLILKNIMKRVDLEVFSKLSDDSQEKVVQIIHIAQILEKKGVAPLSEEDFDELYDRDVQYLQNLAITNAHRFGVQAPPRPNAQRPQQREYPDCPD
jgi:hypothetical protein